MPNIYYSKEELKQILFYRKEESKIFMPNDIFNDLKNNIDINQKNRGCEHIAYAYSYIYLISYLYRYARYGSHLYKEKDLKQILQTPREDKYKNYITKKGGVLDQLHYIKKEKEFPFYYEYEMIGNVIEPAFTFNLEFIKENDLPSELIFPKLPKNHKINFPYRAFYSPTKYVDENGEIIKEENSKENPEEFYSEGYFFNIENTHMIPVEVFTFCMSKKDLGTLGFYLYAFLKHMNDMYQKGFDCSKKKMMKLTGLKSTSMSDTLKALESYNMIYNSHQPYYINLHEYSEELKLLANTYKAYDYKQFKTEQQDVIAREIINLSEDYIEHIEQIQEITDKEIDQFETL